MKEPERPRRSRTGRGWSRGELCRPPELGESWFLGDAPGMQFLYERNLDVALHFWEWRNKILGYSFTGIGASIAAIRFTQADFPEWRWIVALGGMAVAAQSFLLETRCNKIIRAVYDVGAALEMDFLKLSGGPFTRIRCERGLLSFTYIVRGTLVVVFVLLAVLGIPIQPILDWVS